MKHRTLSLMHQTLWLKLFPPPTGPKMTLLLKLSQVLSPSSPSPFSFFFLFFKSTYGLLIYHLSCVLISASQLHNRRLHFFLHLDSLTLTDVGKSFHFCSMWSPVLPSIFLHGLWHILLPSWTLSCTKTEISCTKGTDSLLPGIGVDQKYPNVGHAALYIVSTRLTRI